MIFIHLENFGKIGLKIAKNGVFFTFFGSDRAYPDFTQNLQLVSGKWAYLEICKKCDFWSFLVPFGSHKIAKKANIKNPSRVLHYMTKFRSIEAKMAIFR